jgi:hypothetical protein
MTARFGDNVRIADSPETQAKGIAGLVGIVYGETTPSISEIDVVGEAVDDFALNVCVDGIEEEIWLAPDLVEFLDHGAGQTIRLDGVDKEWVRSESGEWVEYDLSSEKSPWWKFW